MVSPAQKIINYARSALVGVSNRECLHVLDEVKDYCQNAMGVIEQEILDKADIPY